MLSVDEAEDRFLEIYSDVADAPDFIISEEDSKVRVITRVFTECLGWSFNDISSETKHENGFSDYIFSVNCTPQFVVEAKRIGILEIESTERKNVKYLKLNGSSLKKCSAGIEQAFSYASPNGLSLAVLTDGLIWVVFKTHIPGENYKSKQGIVYPSLDAIKNDFGTFYELLSKGGVEKRLFNSIFDDIHHNRMLISHNLKAPIDDDEIKLTEKTDIAYDLARVFAGFFERLSGNDDDDMMVECFVESHESRIADYSLEKITTSVLCNLSREKNNVDGELSKIISNSIAMESVGESEQSIFIVGPTGSGKTTFLERFFSKTLSKAIRDKCIVLNVNCLDSSGDDQTIINWMIERLIVQLEGQLYTDGIPTWDDLRGLYHGQYLRRVRGVDKELYETDKSAFKIKFGEFLENEVERDREGYLNRILKDVLANRHMLPIIVIDNTDEFSLEFKTKIFQLSNSIKRNIMHCMLFFPVTDKSAWVFSKTDIFSIHQSRSFFLPTPSPKEVFRKRINYINGKLSSSSSDDEKKLYFSKKGIGISIADINSFARLIEDVFVNHDYTSKTLGELTNFNIRRTLLLSQRVITSPVIKIDDLIKSYISGSVVTASFTKFIAALILGDYSVYKQGDAPEICPLFNVTGGYIQSPLLKVRILSLLKAIQQSNKLIEDKHLTVPSIIGYFDTMGVHEATVEHSLIELFEQGLIEPYDLSMRSLSAKQRFTISYKGSAHLQLASRNGVYFYQMALTTPIDCYNTADRIRATYRSNIRFIEKISLIKSIFSDYLVSEDAKYVLVPNESDKYINQVVMLKNISGFGNKKRTRSELVSTLGSYYKKGTILRDVDAIVDAFDVNEMCGRVSVENHEESIYFDFEQLKALGVDLIHDGDILKCDIARGDAGVYIEKVRYIIDHKDDAIVDNCKVTKFFLHRGYGFCKFGTGQDAFFHKTVFNESIRRQLVEGFEFKAEIILNQKGDYQIRRVVEN
ncbi:AAA family ATPase [Plesiomonas shigelloides]|uniref:AAA family ATPase n=1 Tax=Plesiomonas shigelloides TaxID=703 RepID=UPI001E5A0CBD|nr:AAA family ATPase [Plesiomonas shigelloides]